MTFEVGWDEVPLAPIIPAELRDVFDILGKNNNQFVGFQDALTAKAEAEGWHDPDGPWFSIDGYFRADMQGRQVILGKHDLTEDGKPGKLESQEPLYSPLRDARGLNPLIDRYTDGQYGREAAQPLTEKEIELVEADIPPQYRNYNRELVQHGVFLAALRQAGRFAPTERGRYVMFRGQDGLLKIAPNLPISRAALIKAGFTEDKDRSLFDGSLVPVIDDYHTPVSEQGRADPYYLEVANHWRKAQDTFIDDAPGSTRVFPVHDMDDTRAFATYVAYKPDPKSTPDVLAGVAERGPMTAELAIFLGNTAAELSRLAGLAKRHMAFAVDQSQGGRQGIGRPEGFAPNEIGHLRILLAAEQSLYRPGDPEYVLAAELLAIFTAGTE